MRERAAETLGRLLLALARDERVDVDVRACTPPRRCAMTAWDGLKTCWRCARAEALGRLGRAEEAEAWLGGARMWMCACAPPRRWAAWGGPKKRPPSCWRWRAMSKWTIGRASMPPRRWANGRNARVLPELERIARRDKSEAVRRAAQQAVERIRRRGGAG
jgi:hypothetical protein